MRRRTFFAAALGATTAVALPGCGRSSGQTASTGAASSVASGPATGNLTVWAMGAEGEKLPELAKKFEAANSGVKVNVTAIPWDAAHDKFNTAITARKTPDMAMVGTTWMGEFATQGALDPKPASIDSSAFFPGAQKTTEVNGTAYGIPWYVETRVVFYRKDLAAKAGFAEPPKDWEGLKAMAKAMQDKAGAKYGMGFQAGGVGSWQSIMPFGWSNDADLTKDDGKAYNFDSPQVLDAVKYYQSYFTDGISDKAAPVQPTTEPDFKSGRVPMFLSGPWMMSAVEKVGVTKDQYDVMQIPAKTKSSSFVGGSDLVVFKKSKQRDTAWKFIQWLSDPKTQVKWYQSSTDLPAVKAAWQDPALTADTKLAKFGKQLETAQAPPSFPTWEQVIASFDTEMEKVTKQGADAAAALKSVQQQADTIGTGQ